MNCSNTEITLLALVLNDQVLACRWGFTAGGALHLGYGHSAPLSRLAARFNAGGNEGLYLMLKPTNRAPPAEVYWCWEGAFRNTAVDCRN
jgi:hypothetical protein